MSHRRIPNNFRRLNKKKLVIAAIVIGCMLLVVLLIVGAVAVAIVGTLIGQADSNLGKSIADLIATLWNAGLDFVRALWKQVIANPLQFLTGGNN